MDAATRPSPTVPDARFAFETAPLWRLAWAREEAMYKVRGNNNVRLQSAICKCHRTMRHVRVESCRALEASSAVDLCRNAPRRASQRPPPVAWIWGRVQCGTRDGCVCRW